MLVSLCDLYFNGVCFFFFKQKTAYEMRISDWSSDVCSSDLREGTGQAEAGIDHRHPPRGHRPVRRYAVPLHRVRAQPVRRTQLPEHLPVADRDHHLRLAAGFLAGGGEPDPDAVGTAEDAAGGAEVGRPDPQDAGALRPLPALDPRAS